MADAKRANGTIAADAQAVPISPNGRGCVAIELTGTWVINLDVKSLIDGTEENAKIYNAAGAAVSLPLTTNQIVYAYAAGREQIIVRANGFTSGSAAVVMNATDGLPFIASAGGGGGGGAVTAANPGDFVDGWDATQGLTTSTGIITDINGTAQGFRRGNIKMWLNYLARFPAALGSTTASASLPVTLSTDGQFTTSTGSLTETAPATDIASSGLNGRLQRVAQRITSLITALGSPFQAGGSIGNTTFASTQSGTWTVQPGNTANTTAWKVDGSAVTQPVSGTVTSTPSGTQTVQGGAAAGAGVAGNPVRVGISDGTSAQDWKQVTNTTAAQAVTGIPATGILAFNSTNSLWVNPVTASADGVNAVNSLIAVPGSYNGSNVDRARNNVDATLLASAARTITQGPTTLTTYNLGAIVFVLDMTTVGTGSVTLTINEVDPASGKSILLLSGAAVTTNSTNVYTIDPVLTAAANSIAKNRITRTLSWTVTANNANTATYSLGTMQQMP